MDFVTDDDEGFDFFVEVVEADLFEIAAGMLADEIEQGWTLGVGLVNSFACAVSAEAIGCVASNDAFFEKKCPCISGADVDDECAVALHGGSVHEAASCFQINETRHFTIIDRVDVEAASNAHAVEKDVMIICLG